MRLDFAEPLGPLARPGSDVPASEAARERVVTEPETASPSLHEVLARGIDKGLRDVGADQAGLLPSTLTGHVIRELRAAGMHPGLARRREPSADEPQWRIGIEVPMRLPSDQRHELFGLVADLVHDWEPDERDGWDVNVYGCPAADDAPDHFHPATEEAQR